MVIKVSSRFIRYFLICVGILIFVFASQIFFQNFSMDSTIKDLKRKQKEMQEKTLWVNKYYKPYLTSEISKIIFSHRNGILRKNEIVINVVSFETEKNIRASKYNKLAEKNKLTWNEFFWQILGRLDLVK